MLIYLKHIVSIFLIAVGGFSFSFAQIHLEPPNGGDGVVGPNCSSFIIKWASVDSAYTYEYVRSDNPNCFAGCSGDTRQDTVNNTTAILNNLQEKTWYYWITRIYYTNGNTSNWSAISSFLAKTPEAVRIVKIALNPLRDKTITVNIDWLVNPDAKKISFELYSISGHKIATKRFIEKNNAGRYQSYDLSFNTIPKGLYIAVFIVDDNPNNPNNKIIHRIIVP
ncbi:MAG: hypothetical protein IIA88_03615 [Bacteroidetes bacterium]|nr:hypothetical protein [Bacteroidota bacterium]